MYNALNQLTADWVDLGVLNSRPTHIPLSLFRPPVFCLLPFFNNLTVLMTSNNLDSTQDGIQDTTVPKLYVNSRTIFFFETDTLLGGKEFCSKVRTSTDYLDLI